MEASVLSHSGSSSAALLQDPRARFLRLQSDERLVALTRRGNDAAFETLIDRYRTRLLAFCRHMVGSTEDAEDILQEVFVSAYRAMLADERELNVRPWLYRIARNRSLNHLRRPRPTGMDSMDIFEGGASVATADRVHDKLDLEDLVEDVKRLPETQRTALMLREMGDLSYDQIAETMDTTIPSVKSLLVRARVSLAEAAESRRMSCDEVRLEIGAVAEGLQKLSAPARRHVGDCERCRAFKKDMAATNRRLTMLAPVGVLASMKALVGLKLFGGASVAGSGAAAAGGGSGAAAGAGAAGAAAAGAGTVSSGTAVGLSAVAAKVGTGLVAAALVTGGVAQVASHDIKTAKADQRAVAASAAPKAANPSTVGGPTPAVVAVAAAPAEKTEPTGATGAAAQPVTAQTSLPAAGHARPVVEKDETSISLGGEHGISETVGNETPGLPTSSEQPSNVTQGTGTGNSGATTGTTPRTGDASTGTTGDVSGGTGGATGGPTAGDAGPTE